ncbi:hypothetical protein A2867_02720 [Candidatus Daviesbacteria bacterium RIFCSPHIGHO2_01_FULL_40_11]|uniref:NAD-dependent epimerase/dehydratase domain-containing protein n=1 Tax=Candidatus Daviesbacteria bacterium RIFCSPHIGHO2_01_FULL_40_11 TaxID=1797762 RepID=A0A1F5JH55_9BACT|nr:MAG: hypothetical protein A2867_02720 [Candidatus Daviesbacteria bacterium RIFCSPHIGHO2_01_FULL_40_11]
MDEIGESINKKNSILLSRNNPVALVVGAAGFLGSHLVDRLLVKGIQVVGVDDLENGKKQNLHEAVGNKNFHLLIKSPDELDLSLPRLDYLFIVSPGKWSLERVLELFKKNKCRCLLVSSINLYERGSDGGSISWFKEAEKKIAKFAGENNLNARVLRLGPVYGPRMDFETKDPLIRLIQQALTDDLQKDVTLEFSSRALYVSDVVDLVVRTIFAGSTAQKIFDGVLPTPVKVAEAKQVLLDPVWYESRNFVPSELPPWSTPNLDKTIKTLNWYPKTDLVVGFRKTLQYFKDNEIHVPKLEEESSRVETKQKEESWDEEKKKALKVLKQDIGDGSREGTETKKRGGLPKFPVHLSKIYLILIVALITYSLIWPGLVLGWGILSFRYQLGEGLKNLEKGEFGKSLRNINGAKAAVSEAKSIFDSLEPIRKTNLFKQQFELGDNLLNLSILSVTSARSSVSGMQALLRSISAVTGELTESPSSYFDYAKLELTSASEDLDKAHALIKSGYFNKELPPILARSVTSLSGKLALYSNLVDKAEAMSVLLPKLVALDGTKNYLILLQNNMELRPAGGFIGSFAKVAFENGKLKKLEVNDIYAIDGQLGFHVEPPKEIKEDLGQKDWFLRDSNWESDFPTSARQAQWFYTKETGERVEGVVAIDISAMEGLLSSIGGVELADYKEKITSENLFEKAVTHAELSFFPGTQAKKSFLTALTNAVFEKIFFLPQNNWPGIISSLGKSLDEKHISIYLNDPKLFSFIVSQNWAHVLPRQTDQNTNQDFLSSVEANLGANKVNYYLDRSYNLETVVGKFGEIQHRLRINYTNRSPSDTFPGGKYKNRMRIYLPFSSQLTRVLWGETDITKSVSSFVDFGRSGYSMLLELAPKEQKTLVLDYSVPVKLEFQRDSATYRLDVVKQAGTGRDPFQWTISYPLSFKIASSQTQNIGPQEQTISTDLSVDRSFEVEFRK